MVQATHPFIVVEGERVLGSFCTLDSAKDFIAEAGYSAFVLRHRGQKWVTAKGRGSTRLLTHSKFGPKQI